MLGRIVLLLLAVSPFLQGYRLHRRAQNKAEQKNEHREVLAKAQSHLKFLYPAVDWNANSTSSLLQYIRADILADSATSQAMEATHLGYTFQQTGGVPMDHSSLFFDNGLVAAAMPLSSMLQVSEKFDEPDPIEFENDTAKRAAKLIELEKTMAKRTITKWADGVVFIRFDLVIEERVRSILLRAIFEFERATCIRFVDITSDGCPEDLPEAQQKSCQSPVIVVSGDVCSGNIGFVGNQKSDYGPGQLLTIGPGCDLYGVLLHELGHIVGIDHEQNRWDRDDYVSVHVENIMDDRFLIAFAKVPWSGMVAEHQDTPYDLHSVMHYEPCAFGNSKPGYQNNYVCQQQTLTVKDPASLNSHEVVGQRIRLSVMDVVKFNKMYDCKHSVPWGGGVAADEAFPTLITFGQSSAIAWPGDRTTYVRQRVQRGVPVYQDADGKDKYLVLNKRAGWRLCMSPSCSKLLYRPNQGHIDIEANPVLLPPATWSGPFRSINDIIVRGGPAAVFVSVRGAGFEGFQEEEWSGYYWSYAKRENPRADFLHMECQIGQCKKLEHQLVWLPGAGSQAVENGFWSLVRGSAVIAFIKSTAWSPTDIFTDVNRVEGAKWHKVDDESVTARVVIEYSYMTTVLDSLD